MTKPSIIAGIDYSMTSPAICVHVGDKWSIDNCVFYFKTDKKKLATVHKHVRSSMIEPYTSQEQRFYNNAQWAIEVLNSWQVELVVLEGYAMAAKGLVFHIGEHTGILKNQMWRHGYKFVTPPPTVVKKFATGKGNANKDVMELSFEAETNFKMRSQTGQSIASNSPSNDLVDAYYMAKYGFHS